ncbi:MAG: hypothetical protein ACYTAF_07445 [Planctomycetota bacterium]|jgi:YVTN family beta-propeller protein
MMRTTSFVLLTFALLCTALPAQDGWVVNRPGGTINVFDAATNAEANGSPITVGTTPVGLASINAPDENPHRIYVVNMGSNDITVIDASSLGFVKTITGDAQFGNLVTPCGIVRAESSGVGPMLVVVDQAQVGTGRSTVRFINISTATIEDQFFDMSGAALFTGVTYSTNGRIWITDAGDQGVVVIKLYNLYGGAQNQGTVLLYQGQYEFADFIHDTAVPVTYMVNPQKVAVDADNKYVVVTDAGSANVTVIRGDYVNEAAALLANVSVAGLGATATRDVVIVGTKAYVTTDVAGANAIAVIELTGVTNNTVPTTITGMAGTADGIGADPDGTSIYVGETTGGAGQITEIDVATDTVAAVVPNPFTQTGNTWPFAFLFTKAGGSGVGLSIAGKTGSGGKGCHGGAAANGSLGFCLIVAVFGLAVLRRL